MWIFKVHAIYLSNRKRERKCNNKFNLEKDFIKLNSLTRRKEKIRKSDKKIKKKLFNF